MATQAEVKSIFWHIMKGCEILFSDVVCFISLGHLVLMIRLFIRCIYVDIRTIN